MDYITLNNGVEIPQLGLGVYKAEQGRETMEAVRWAIDAGYRHIDTAMIYGNEADVRQGIVASGLGRDDIFLTTKLWNEDITAGRAREAFEESCKRLDTDYIDLYLLHWPVKGYVEAWLELEKLYREGKIRAIGLSNFNPHHVEDILEAGSVLPAVNQIESHPKMCNQELIDWCKAKDIDVEVWRPLGGFRDNPVLGDPAIVAIAEKYGKTTAQVVIRWHLQRGVIVFPKSVHRDRIESNIDVFDFELTAEEMAAISALDEGLRLGPDPEVMAAGD